MRIHHIALRTTNVAALLGFYREVLGLPLRERRPNGSIWLAAGDAILMLEVAAPGEPGINAGSMEFFSFRIAKEQRTSFLEKLQGAGVALEAESDFTLYFRDPDGRRIGVSHFPDAVRTQS